MANRRISDLPAITSVDINDADLFTIVHVSEVDPGLKNKKLTFTEHKTYLNNYYLQLTGGTVTNLTVANTLNVSGSSTVRGNLNVLATGIFNALSIGNITVTGTISGSTITGQTIQGSNINGGNASFVNLQVTENATINSGIISAISGNTITGNIIRASGITGQIISGDAIQAINISGTSVTGVTGVYTTLLSGAFVTGNTINATTFTGVSGVFTSLSGSSISGTSLNANYATFTGVSGASFAAGGIVFASGAGDVRPFNQFSFPQSPGISGYVLTTLGNGQTAWGIATSTGIVFPNIIAETKTLIDIDYVIGVGYNGISEGPVEIKSGVSVTIPSGSTWRVLGPEGSGNILTIASIYVSGVYSSSINPVSSFDINCSSGNYHIKTITGNSVFTVSNVPPSCNYAFALELEHINGSITWFSGVEWPNGVAPTLTTGKTHLFMFQTDNSGSRWRASSLVNYTT